MGRPINTINIGFNIGAQTQAKPYEGEYEITPKTYAEQILPTKNKKRLDNLKVKNIPKYELSNSAEGYTLMILEESLNPYKMHSYTFSWYRN